MIAVRRKQQQARHGHLVSQRHQSVLTHLPWPAQHRLPVELQGRWHISRLSPPDTCLCKAHAQHPGQRWRHSLKRHLGEQRQQPILMLLFHELCHVAALAEHAVRQRLPGWPHAMEHSGMLAPCQHPLCPARCHAGLHRMLRLGLLPEADGQTRVVLLTHDTSAFQRLWLELC